MASTSGSSSTSSAPQLTASQKPTLERLPGAANADGVRYEWKVAALLALRAYRRGLPFQMFTNVKAARPFDDLVLRLQDPDEGELTYYIQLKHSKNTGKLTEQALVAAKGDFSIPKYFELFGRLRDWYSKSKTDRSADELWLTQTPVSNVRFLLLTTKDVERRTSVDEEFRHLDLFATGKEDSAYTNAVQLSSAYTQVWELFANDPHRQQAFQQDFLPRLRLLCCQASVQQLDANLADELREAFGQQTWLQPEDFLSFVEKWTEGTEGACVSADDLIGLLQRQLQQWAKKVVGNFVFKDECLSVLRTALFPSAAAPSMSSAAPPTSAAPSMSSAAPSTSAAPSMSSAARRVRVCVRGAPEPGRRAAKLLQLLQEDYPEEWLYVDSAILTAVPTASLAAAALRGRVLVTDLKGGRQDKKRLVALQRVLKNQIVEVALHTEGDGTSPFIDKWHLSDLQQEAQEKLMQRDLYFQSHQTTLEALMGIWPSLHDDVKANFMLLLDGNQKPKIGKNFTKVDCAVFIPRHLSYQIVVSSEVLTSGGDKNYFLFLEGFPEKILNIVASNHKISHSDIKENTRWKIIDTGITFESIQQQLKTISKEKNCPIYWLKYYSGEDVNNLIIHWRRTVENKELMEQMVQKIPDCCSLEPEGVCSSFCPRTFKKVLLVGEAGVGKSIIFEKLATQMKEDNPHEWIILIKILNHLRILRKWREVPDLTLDHVLDLLSEAAVGADVGTRAEAKTGQSCLESSLRSGCRVFIFIDGVDEVAPGFEDKIIDLLQLLQKQPNITLCVSTRPEVEASLQRTMQCPSLYLQPLSEEEQKQYLCSLWASQRHKRHSSLDEEEEEEEVEEEEEEEEEEKVEKEKEEEEKMAKAERLLRILSDETGGLQSTPLHLHMAAEVFSEGTFMLENFNLLNLYELFIERKKNLFEEKHNTVNDNIPFEKFEELHEGCAAFFLFADSSDKEIFEIEALEKEVRENQTILKGKEKTGILWMDEAGGLHFAHQSYAEFFAAKWLWRKVKSSEGVQRYVSEVVEGHKVERERLRRFLLLMLAEESPLHAFAWLHNNSSDLRAVAVLLENVKQADWVKRDLLSNLPLEDLFARIHQTMGEISIDEFKEELKEELTEKSRKPWLAFALIVAGEFGFMSIVKELLRRAKTSDADYLQRLSNCDPPQDPLLILSPYVLSEALKNAARGPREQHTAIVKELLDNGAKDSAKLYFPTAHYYSVYVGNIATVKILLQHSSTEINRQGIFGRTSLHLAFDNWDDIHYHEIAQLLIHHPDIDLNSVDGYGVTTLEIALRARCKECILDILQKEVTVSNCHLVAAAEANCVDSLQYMIDHGMNPLDANDSGFTAFHAAAKKGSMDILCFLSDKGFPLNIQDKQGKTPLHYAVEHEKMEVVKKLIVEGADLRLEDNNGNRALDIALDDNFWWTSEHIKTKMDVALLLLAAEDKASKAENNISQEEVQMLSSMNHLEQLKYLQNNFVDTNLTSKSRNSLLHIAAGCDSIEAVDHLIKHNAKVQADNATGNTPLLLAANKQSIESITMLLKKGAYVNVANTEGYTALHFAARNRSVESISLLLEKGALVNVHNAEGDTPLHLVSKNGSVETVALLLENNASVNAVNVQGDTPLHLAAVYRTPEAITLLKNGASVNAVNAFGDTPLHVAARNGHEEPVTLFLKNRATVNAVNAEGDTPLHYAARYGKPKVVTLLLENGAYVNAVNAEGNTPLHFAAKCMAGKSAAALLKNGASVNAVNALEDTPLHSLARYGEEETATLLLKIESSVNEGNVLGDILHQLPARNISTPIITQLLQNGASLNAVNAEGDSPLHIAARYRDNGSSNSSS